MRYFGRPVLVLCSLFLSFLGVLNAHANVYIPNVTCIDTTAQQTCQAANVPATVDLPGPFTIVFDVQVLDPMNNVIQSFAVSGAITAQDQPGDLFQYTVDTGTGTVVFSDVTQTGSDLFSNGTCPTGLCGDVTFAPVTAPVPEPSALMLMGSGALGLLGRIRIRIGAARKGRRHHFEE